MTFIVPENYDDKAITKKSLRENKNQLFLMESFTKLIDLGHQGHAQAIYS